jgi:hypothetical protein
VVLAALPVHLHSTFFCFPARGCARLHTSVG